MMRRRSAFTILELLTVIGILGLLISIVVPSLSAARRQAKANVCLSHLKNIGTGFELYLNENEDRFPPFQLVKLTPTTEDFYVNSYGRRAPRWQWFIETGLGPVIDPTPFRRLTDGFGDEGLRIGREGTTMAHEVFTCPSLTDDEFAMDIRDGAYGYNYQYLGNTRQDTNPARWDNFPVGRHQIRNLGKTILLADSRGAGKRHGRHSFTLDPPRLAVERRATRFGPDPHVITEEPGGGDLPPNLDRDTYAYSPAEARHTRRSNVLFTDTHAEAMTLVQLGYQISDASTPVGVPKGTAIPVKDPESDTYTANNKLWNGDAYDPIAEEHRPEKSGG